MLGSATVSLERLARRWLQRLWGVAIQSLEPCIGRLGTLAKQVAYMAKGSLLTRSVAYPVEIGLSWLDPVLSVGIGNRSYASCLVAK